MAELADDIGQLRLRDVVLPGTHGSCTYAISAGSSPSPDCPAVLRSLLAFLSSSSTRASVPADILDQLASAIVRLTRLQACTVAEQLDAGIRYLEVQVAPRPEHSWNVLNLTRMTGLPKAQGKPAFLVHRQRHHIAFRDVPGDVWDVRYGGWKVRNLTTLADSALAYSSPAASAADGMLYVAYRDGNDHIRLLCGQGRWRCRDLTEITRCPRAESSPATLHCRGEARIFFRDAAGRLWLLHERNHRWSCLNLSELVGLPKVAGDPSAFEHDGLVSVFCHGVDGAVHEIYYDGRWNLRALGHTIEAPAAATAPIAVGDNAGRRLFYRDVTGDIWELRHDGEHWTSQNLSRLTGAVQAGGNLRVVRHRQQLHVIYCDAAGDICDLREDVGWGKHNLTQVLGAGKATGSPAAIVYRGELHVVHCGVNGEICDLHHTGAGVWRQHNLTRATGSTSSVAGPVCIEWQGQHHVLYQGDDRAIHDLYYDRSQWKATRLTRVAGRLKAVAGPVMVEYHGRQHVLFRDAAGALCDLSFDHAWQRRNLLEPTGAPQPASDPALCVVGLQYHVVYRDAGNSLWHLCYDSPHGWTAADLRQWSATPPAVGNPLTVEYRAAHHVIYRDGDGELWDLCSVARSAQNLTRLTGAPRAVGDPTAILCDGEPRLFFRDADGGLTEMRLHGDWKSRSLPRIEASALPAGDPAAALFHGRAHIVYRDRAGHIRHLSEDHGWETLDLTKLARCPIAATDPLLCADADDELHVLYQDQAGDLHDLYFARETFYACRAMFAERIDEVIAAVAEFLARHRKEIVVLDFNRFHQMTERCHEALANKLLAAFGPMLVALPRARLQDVTLGELWRADQRVLVLYDNRPAVESHPQLWSNERERQGERARGVISAPRIEAGDAEALEQQVARAIDASRTRSRLFVLKGIIAPDPSGDWGAWAGEALAPPAVAISLLETMRGLDHRLTQRDEAVPRMVARWMRDERIDRSLNIVAVDHFEASDLVEAVKLANRRHRAA
jgi:hypothetical protein